MGLENLGRALPERKDHRWILLESLRLQGAALLDALWSSRLTDERAQDLLDADPESEQLIRDLLGRGHGLVMATAHFGSWEMLNLGARYDENDGQNSAGATVADDSKISPRLGATWDAKGDGDLVFNAGYGTYVAALAASANIADGSSSLSGAG